VERYEKVHPIQTITFCGGEVFALKWYPELVNQLVDKGIFVQMITNGTIDKLDQFKNPNFINLIVSIDGLETYHDANRGAGNFAKSMAFLQKAKKMGFHHEIFSILTHQNLQQIDLFQKYLQDMLGDVLVTYHPRKPPTYLMHHPVSNIVGETDGFDFLSKEEMLYVMKKYNVFPPPDLGCYQVAVMSDGRVFGCCEGVTPIGAMSDAIEDLFEAMKKRLEIWEKTNTFDKCLGCTQPEFMCGIKEYLKMMAKSTVIPSAVEESISIEVKKAPLLDPSTSVGMTE
jgi:sulfatase maturation enzyme AslB (radical SAM superfamily)